MVQYSRKKNIIQEFFLIIIDLVFKIGYISASDP